MKVWSVDPHNNLIDPAYEGDAGVDIRAASRPTIAGFRQGEKYWKSIDFIQYETNVKIQTDLPENGLVGAFLFPRSSIINYNLILANSVGVIDSGYRDTIKVNFKYIPQPDDYRIHDNWIFLEPNMSRIYQNGDKIAQLVFLNPNKIDINRVNELDFSERGENGIGSSGN
jgi:dUTPase